MFGLLIEIITRGFLFFALHIKNGNSFPSALSAKDEREYFRKFNEILIEWVNEIAENGALFIALSIPIYRIDSDNIGMTQNFPFFSYFIPILSEWSDIIGIHVFFLIF